MGKINYLACGLLRRGRTESGGQAADVSASDPVARPLAPVTVLRPRSSATVASSVPMAGRVASVHRLTVVPGGESGTSVFRTAPVDLFNPAGAIPGRSRAH